MFEKLEDRIMFATVYVSSVYDYHISGLQNLREAVQVADIGDTIKFIPSIAAITVNSVIEITKGLTITGDVLIDAQNNGGVFYVETDPSQTVKLSGLTIANGSRDMGGGIYAMHTNLVLENCTIAFCTAYYLVGNENSGLGGGLYIDQAPGQPASLKMKDTQFIGNVANYKGGGVFVGNPIGPTWDSQVTILTIVDGCKFIGNKAAIISEDGPEYSSLQGTGGGINFDDDGVAPVIKDSIFIYNEALYGGGYNGGPFNSDGNLFINNTNGGVRLGVPRPWLGVDGLEKHFAYDINIMNTVFIEARPLDLYPPEIKSMTIMNTIWTTDGDVNGDKIVDTQDFTLLKNGFGRNNGWTNGDLNADSVVDTQDFTILKANFGNVMRLPSTPDVNFDGIVDTQDFTIIKSNFGVITAPNNLSAFMAGDVNLDYIVDTQDFTVAKSNFGEEWPKIGNILYVLA